MTENPERVASLRCQVRELRCYLERLRSRNDELAEHLRQQQAQTAALQGEYDRLTAETAGLRTRLMARRYRLADRVAGLLNRRVS
jgi:predicted nuclease with TOPRIM domain